jgi:aryl-alcohol dehydrogenase-like predicted oxidoreductase
MAYAPLAQGLLTGKYGPESRFAPDDRRHRLPHFRAKAWPENLRLLDRMRTIAHRRGGSLSQMAVRWVLDHAAISCAIVGAKTPTQVDDSIGVIGWHLGEDERSYLSDPLVSHRE